MKLTPEQQAMLDGAHGRAVRKSMEILTTLGLIYGAQQLIPVSSVQIAGVSYDNLGEAGLMFLQEMADGGGKARLLATLNPAGMDVENWEALGISPEFAANQQRVLQAFASMGVVTTCTCTPYLSGNLPRFGEHIAWAESSAVCYANSVIGARSNREGGPSALASALTGLTPAYGYHLVENRQPSLGVRVEARPEGTSQFGALGKVIGEQLQAARLKPVPYIQGVAGASLEELKSFCASLATYGGAALFHMQGVTPEAALVVPPLENLVVGQADLERAIASLNDAAPDEVDFVSLGCPHLSIREIAHLAQLLAGKKVAREFWITTARPTKQIADRMGYTQIIEASGARFAVDTCCVVAPIQGRFRALATDSAKACYYAYAKNGFKTVFLPFDEVVRLALQPEGDRKASSSRLKAV
ncbi:MAG: aconitase X catalytic domain-containing protein [Anaerolineales bacterium]|nr:aconitase X catalytic domain-containing protein [Anaerolineales bacterium]